jgi:hypothetical protein
MSNIQIVDNFLLNDELKNIQNSLFSNTFPWYYIPEVGTKEDKGLNIFHFNHLVYEKNRINSNEGMEILKPILNKLDIKALIRIKINLYTCTPKIIKHSYHTDTSYKCKTSLFYVNTNNGFTGFKDKIVNSLENRIVNFDSTIPHYSTTCTNSNLRISINFIYF